MDVLLQRHCAKYIYAIPDGLRELMSDISREVLRSQPDQIYSFIADYLDALMITRENARVAARFVESITEVGVTITDLLTRTGMTREEADRVATIIQVAFRKYYNEKAQFLRSGEEPDEKTIIYEILDKANVTLEQAEEAAVIIQNAYRAFKTREELAHDLLKGMVDWRVAARSTLRLYRKTGVSYEEANRAATLIKAAYKGYYTRRIMKRLLEEIDRRPPPEDRFEECTQLSLSYEEQINFFNIEEEEGISGLTLEMPSDLHEELGGILGDDVIDHPLDDDSNVGFAIMDDLLHRVIPDSESIMALPHPSLVDTEIKPEPVVDTEIQPEPVVDTEIQPEPEVDAEIQPEPVVDAEIQPEPVVDTEIKPEEA